MDPVYKLITAPTVEPVTLAQAAAHVRQDSSADDAILTVLITAARMSIEKQYGLYLCTQTVDVYYPSFGNCDRLKVYRGPLASVTSVKYTDSADTENTFASTSYDVDIRRGEIVLKYAASWPTATMRPSDPVVIRGVFGYGAAAAVPSNITQALLLRLGHLYSHREEVTLGNTAVEARALAVGVDHLMSLDRNWKF